MSPILRPLIALLWLICPGTIASAFANAPLGSLIEDRVMPTPDGGREHLLGDSAVNVFIFFKPGQPHSEAVARQLGALQKEFAGKSVRWVAVVSDHIAAASIRQSGLVMPVLVDGGDELYGQLGVVLEPAVGITDREHRLVAYQPYRKINFIESVRAYIRHLLGEIDEQTLARTLTPPPADNGGRTAAAHRRYRLAQKLFQAHQYAKALESSALSLEKDGGVAAYHVLHGQILAALGDTKGARAAYDKALELDPHDESARLARDALPRTVEPPAQ